MSSLHRLLLATALAGFAVTAVAHQGANATESSEAARLSEETREAWAAFQDYGYEQKEEALAAGEDALEAIDARIAELDERAEDAGDAAAARWQARKAQLEDRRDALAEDLAELRAASAATYEAAKDEVVETYDDTTAELADAWNELTS